MGDEHLLDSLSVSNTGLVVFLIAWHYTTISEKNKTTVQGVPNVFGNFLPGIFMPCDFPPRSFGIYS